MPRKAAGKKVDLGEDVTTEEINTPTEVEPYTVLGVKKTATADEIKKAYRKAALKHHPDKADAASKDTAHTKFQEIAFAYAVLSDPLRRKRYDATGSTAGSLSADEDFSFAEFYATQFRDIVTPDAIEAFAKQYKGSVDEREDVLAAYRLGKGSWEVVYERVMLSDPLEDEERFRKVIDEGIEQGMVKGYKRYLEEGVEGREARLEEARGEAAEAEEHARELGVHEQLFGGGKGKGKGKGKGQGGDEDALKALIMQKQGQRESMLDRMEAKYAAIEAEKKVKKAKGKKGKRKSPDEEEDMGEPSEEAFQAAAKRLKKAK